MLWIGSIQITLQVTSEKKKKTGCLHVYIFYMSFPVIDTPPGYLAPPQH